MRTKQPITSMYQSLRSKFTLGMYNRLRIAFIRQGGHPRVPPFTPPKPPLTLLLLLGLMTCVYGLPLHLFTEHHRNTLQHRVDERKMREGTFALQMLEWFEQQNDVEEDDNSNKQQRRKPTVNLMQYETLTQWLHKNNYNEDGFVPSPSGYHDDYEEETIDVERWPTNFEQRHTLFYRNRVRRKMEQLQKQVEQLEREVALEDERASQQQYQQQQMQQQQQQTATKQ